MREKSDGLEKDNRQLKEQLAEMARTATEYSSMIKSKEQQADKLSDQLDKVKADRDGLLREITELQAQIDTLAAEFDSERKTKELNASAQIKLQAELDELRALLEAKVTEETRRSEVVKSKEVELANLRSQVGQLSADLTETRKTAAEAQNKLKVELDTITREHKNIQQSHQSLSDREQTSRTQLKKVEVALAEAEKAKRALESELQAVRSRAIDTDNQLAEMQKAKEVGILLVLGRSGSDDFLQSLERQLASTQSRYADFEDAALQLERDKGALDRQVETLKKQLEAETARRTKLEEIASKHKAEANRLKDINTKFERDMNKVLTDLKKAEWEVKQLEAKQDKTIVEHVHVLEEAKRVTDRQLAEAQVELQKQAAYIRSLEKAKTRLTTEAEDLAREKASEEVALRAKEKKARDQEAKASRALVELENERRAREAAEVHVRRLQNELKDAQGQTAEAEARMIGIQKAKDNLEIELTRLADETEAPNSFAKLQRQYESKIAQLEQQLEESDSAKSAAARIKEHVDRQHAEIRRLIMSSGPKDDSFRNRLLRELQLADEEMERELSHRAQRHVTGNRTGEQTLANVTPSKSRSNGTVRFKDSVTEIPRTPDRHAQVDKLRQQVQALELQMAASTRIRQYLETSLREVTEELQNSDGSKQSFEACRARLAKENARLAELLEEEAEARRAAQAAQLDGVQALWDRFQNTIAQERESYSRLEESRKALVSDFHGCIELVYSLWFPACATTYSADGVRGPASPSSGAFVIQETVASGAKLAQRASRRRNRRQERRNRCVALPILSADFSHRLQPSSAACKLAFRNSRSRLPLLHLSTRVGSSVHRRSVGR